MTDILLTKRRYDNMANWTKTAYNATMGTTPSITNVTVNGLALASNVSSLMETMDTAYDNISTGCSANNTTVQATNNTNQKSHISCPTNNSTVYATNKSDNATYNKCTTNNSTVKSSNRSSYNSDNSGADSDK